MQIAVAVSFEELAHQPDRRPLAAPALNQHAENLALMINGAPQVHPLVSPIDFYLLACRVAIGDLVEANGEVFLNAASVAAS